MILVKKASAIIIVLIVLCTSGCSLSADKVLASIGQYKSKSYFFSGGFQDYTDYAKYIYEDVDFSNNKYFEKISADSKEKLLYHIEDFEEWIEMLEPQNELSGKYDFDASLISEEDYVYIYDNPDYPELGCYDVYFFDMETITLYYFHNNI